MAHDVSVPLSFVLMLVQGDLWRRGNATEDIKPVEAAWRAVSRVLLDAIVLPGLDDNDDAPPEALYNVNTAAPEYVSVPLLSVEPSSASPTPQADAIDTWGLYDFDISEFYNATAPRTKEGWSLTTKHGDADDDDKGEPILAAWVKFTPNSAKETMTAAPTRSGLPSQPLRTQTS